jgi:hypothetical protein
MMQLSVDISHFTEGNMEQVLLVIGVGYVDSIVEGCERESKSALGILCHFCLGSCHLEDQVVRMGGGWNWLRIVCNGWIWY